MARNDQAAIDILWKALAFERIAHLADTVRAFSADDVWDVLETMPKPTDPRLLGVTMKAANSKGLIDRSDLVVSSQRDVNHDRPIAIWTSRKLGGTMQDALAYLVAHKKTINAPNSLEPAALTLPL
jgi:hypothetical protein